MSTYFHKMCYIMFISALILSNDAQATDPDVEPEEPIVSNKSTSCLSQNFHEFLRYFTENIDAQKEFIKYPLISETVSGLNGTKDYSVQYVRLERNQIHFPVIYSEERRKQEGLSLITEKLASNTAMVVLREKKDPDSFIQYYFIYDSCWKLARVFYDTFLH